MAKSSSKKKANARPAGAKKTAAGKTPARSNGHAKQQAGKPAPKPGPTRAKNTRVTPPAANPVVREATRPTRPSAPAPAPVFATPRPSPLAGPIAAKNAAGLSRKETEQFREALLSKRRELVGDMNSMQSEALERQGGGNLSNLPLHMADMGTDNYEQEFTLGLVEKDRQLLREIDMALGKIRDGSYGICEGTGKPIGKARLEAQPWARFSIEHARQMEKGLLRR